MSINTNPIGSSPDGARDNGRGDERGAPIKDAGVNVNTENAQAPSFTGWEDFVPKGTVDKHGKPVRQKDGILSKLYELLGDNIVPIEVQRGKKKPTDLGWTEITIQDAQTSEYRARLDRIVKRGGNLGISLGAPSDNLCAIDADEDEGVEALLNLNPWLKGTFTTRGARGNQFWVRLKGEYHDAGPLIWTDKTAINEKTGKEDWAQFGEWRATGNQSVVFGVHPNGNAYQIVNAAQPVEVAWADIVWPENVKFKTEYPKFKKAAEKQTAAGTDDSDYSQWAKKFDGDLRHLDCKKLVELHGIAITSEDSEKITFRCPCEDAHTNENGDKDCALFFPGKGDRKYVSGGCFHHSCGLDSVTALLDYLENAKPGCINECCTKKYTGNSSNGADKEFWGPIEGACAQKLIAEKGPFKCVGQDWYAYDNGIWKPTTRDIFRKDVMKYIPETWKTEAHGMCVLRRVEAECQIRDDELCGAAKFNKSKTRLAVAVQNGVLLFVHGENAPRLSAFNPDYGFTASLDVDWNPEAGCPMYDKLLNESLDDPQDRALLLDFFATALFPDARWEAALVIQGEAGTSKSTTVSPMEKIFGRTATSLSLADLCHPSGYKLAGLRYSSLNISTELNTLEIGDTGLFKQLVSGERFTARKIYGHPFEMCATCSFAFLANSLPRFKHGTDAEARRLRFVKFAKKPAKVDVKLKDKVAAEAEGVFVLLVKRAVELFNGRDLAEQGRYGQEVASRFKVSNDPMGSFISTRCVLGADKWLRKEDLVRMFEEFREEAAIPMGFDANVFCRTLYDRFQGVKAGRRMVNGERLYVVNGIGVKSEAGPAPEAPKAATREQRSRARRQAEVQAKYNAAEKESATARKDTGEAEDDGGYDTGIYGGEKPF